MASTDGPAEFGPLPFISSADMISDGAERHVGQRRRFATLYDAVAGNLYHDRRDRDSDTSPAESHSDSDSDFDAVEGGGGADDAGEQPRQVRHTTRHIPYAPEEVLFRRKDAPERFAEHDVYFAHERELPDRSVLPDSDLLKAIHSYASRFYAAKRHVAGKLYHNDTKGAPCSTGKQDGTLEDLLQQSLDEYSMDETALIAFGILLEEAGRDVLGRRGDLVFTEGLDGATRDHAAGEIELSSRLTLDTADGAEVGEEGDIDNERAVKRRKTLAR